MQSRIRGSCCVLWSLSPYTSALPDAWYHRQLSLADKTNFLKPQAQEGSGHRHVPDPRLASDLELPELLCAGAAPEVTAELLILDSYQDFPPSKPHLGTQAQVCDELRRGLYETSRDSGAILKTTTRGQQNPGVQTRSAKSQGRPHSRQEGWGSLSLPHPRRSPRPPHTETRAPAPAEFLDLFALFPRPGTVLYVLNMAKVGGLQTWLQIWITRGAL